MKVVIYRLGLTGVIYFRVRYTRVTRFNREKLVKLRLKKNRKRRESMQLIGCDCVPRVALNMFEAVVSWCVCIQIVDFCRNVLFRVWFCFFYQNQKERISPFAT